MIRGVCSQGQETKRNGRCPPLRAKGGQPGSSGMMKSRLRMASARRPWRPSRRSCSRRLTSPTASRNRPRAPRRMQALAIATATWLLPVPVPPIATTLRGGSRKEPSASWRSRRSSTRLCVKSKPSSSFAVGSLATDSRHLIERAFLSATSAVSSVPRTRSGGWPRPDASASTSSQAAFMPLGPSVPIGSGMSLRPVRGSPSGCHGGRGRLPARRSGEAAREARSVAPDRGRAAATGCSGPRRRRRRRLPARRRRPRTPRRARPRHRGKDPRHLPIAVVEGAKPVLNRPERFRQSPALERGAVAQRAGLALEHGHAAEPVAGRPAAIQAARAAADRLAVKADIDPVRMGERLRRLPGRPRLGAAAVAVEAREAGPGDAPAQRAVAVEGPRKGNQAAALLARERLPDRQLGVVGMRMLPRMPAAALLEPAVQAVEAVKARRLAEQPLADVANLVLDPALLPRRVRRACRRTREEVPAHLRETGVELPRPPAKTASTTVFMLSWMPRRQEPPNSRNARLRASKTISRVSRGCARTKLMRLWHRRMCATLSRTVVPPMTARSWLQSNWQASPGSNARGTQAPDTPPPWRRFHAAAQRQTALQPASHPWSASCPRIRFMTGRSRRFVSLSVLASSFRSSSGMKPPSFG